MPHSQHGQDASATAAGSQIPVTFVADSLEKPLLDDRSYRVIRLSNELEALLVHDPETDKVSAALDVNVGNFSDESDIPGMAHAVEHLIFMGTKKFPVENEYGQYLSAKSGSSNAYTGQTSTNYFFDISAKPDNDQDPSDSNPSPLREALDRFAQFFIEPFFLLETLDRELKAVDSENKKNLQNDTWRLHQLEKSLSNPNHPFCHFSTGNFEALKTLPEARGINVRDKFIKFHVKHYSANRMKNGLLSFSLLSSTRNYLPTGGPASYRSESLTSECNGAKPVMDSRELNLYFPFIDEEFMFATQPSRYISHLIGHEGPGSIMSYIKSKGWANGLSAGAYPVCPGTPGIFYVEVRLTEEGLKNYPEIVKIFFQYVTLLRENPPQEWIFQEQKGMADVNFKFKQKTPAKWLLSGHSRLQEFAPDQIEGALSTIRPENFRMVIVSRSHPGNWDQKEKRYGTEYRHEKIPDDLMNDIKKAAAVSPKERLSALHLPHKNQFIPNKLEVEKKEVDEPALNPRVLRNDNISRTWWKKDDTFWVPHANVIVSLKTPLIYASAENNIKARLFTYLVRDALEEKTLMDKANVNHCVETWFYVGSREDHKVRTKTLLLDQMLHEPAFDQLRTKDGPRAFSTTDDFQFRIQSEMTPEFLDFRSEAFLMRHADTLEKISDTEFDGHKRSLIVRRLKKLRNLDQESTRHWSQITNEYYDFELAQRDAAQITLLAKPEVAEFFNEHLNPSSTRRARLSIHLQAQGKAEGVDKRQEEAQKKADEEPSAGDAVKTAEEITDVILYKAGLTVSSGARPVKDISEYADTDAKL
ncbi:hypothetical protein ACHAPM_011478 [Fusarium culmorum]